MPADDQNDLPTTAEIAGGAASSNTGEIAGSAAQSTTGEIAGGAALSATADQASVAAQLRGVHDALEQLGELPVDAQVAVFTDLHQQLTAVLAVTATATGPVDDSPRQRPGSTHRGR